jgi:hypothetical protein
MMMIVVVVVEIPNIYAILSTKNFDLARMRPHKQEPNVATCQPSCILQCVYKPTLPK